MIISEKQIMKLINIAHYYAVLAAESRDLKPIASTAIDLIMEIENQQSEELKGVN